MEFSLDMNIKLGEKNHKHVAIVSIREPESGEYAEFYGTVSPVGRWVPSSLSLYCARLSPGSA